MTAAETERRRYIRFEPAAVVEVDSEAGIPEFVAACVGDISLGGIFIRTETPMEEGTHVQLRLPYNNDANVCEIEGHVVRKVAPGAEQAPGVGIEFAFTGSTAKGVLQKVIDQYTAGDGYQPRISVGQGGYGAAEG